MIQVLQRAFDIVEMLAEAPEQPRPLREIAGRLRLHPATCANILRTLAERGYVDQPVPRQGYLLGPALHHAVRHGPYRKDLTAVAEPLMAALAKAVDETVLLVTLRQGRRFVLCQIDGRQAVQVGRNFLFQTTTYETATGRLLLASLDPDALEDVVRRAGLPGRPWPEAATRPQLQRALAAIRGAGWVCLSRPEGVVGLAFPVRNAAGAVAAALGLFLPAGRWRGRHRQEIVKGLRETAEGITRGLSASAAPSEARGVHEKEDDRA